MGSKIHHFGGFPGVIGGSLRRFMGRLSRIKNRPTGQIVFCLPLMLLA